MGELNWNEHLCQMSELKSNWPKESDSFLISIPFLSTWRSPLCLRLYANMNSNYLCNLHILTLGKNT